MQGYTIAWASDVSETGFSREGIAIVPDEKATENAGSDQTRWLGLSSREREANLRMRIGTEVLAEKKITQEMRQSAFDSYALRPTMACRSTVLQKISREQILYG